MNLAPHQEELLRLNPELDPRDIPRDWHSAADLDAQERTLRQKRLAAEATRAKAAQAPRTDATLDDTLEQIGRFIGEELNKIDARIAEIEARPAFDYTGTFESGKAYKRGQGCTHQGSIFVCMRDYPGTPATADSGWMLACKRGRDGKDGKPLRKHHAIA